MTAPIGKMLNIAAACAGASGTVLLYRGSFAYDQLTPLVSDDVLNQLRKANKDRQLRQKLGLGLILLGFIVGGFSELFN